MMVLTIYMLSAFLLLVAAFVVFRIFVRGDYRRKGRLTLFSALLEWVIFSLWGTFTWLDLPPDWPPSYVCPVLKTIGWILVVVGAVGLFSTIATFGFRRAHGLDVNLLKQSGLYRLTRNPQILVCSLVVIGYAMLWPSWHTLGWVVLFAVIAHMMVLTEEEHLRTVYGEEYVRYCERVPRYLGFRGKSKKDAA